MLTQTKRIPASEEEQYYSEAASWAEEKYRSASYYLKWWQIGFISMLILTLLTVAALISLLPLKTVEPYVIKVDKSTGIVEIIEPLTPQDIPQDEALTKYWIVKYLNAREQYDLQRFNDDTFQVSKMSSAQVFNEYSNEYAPSRESSPYNIFGDSGKIKIHIRDIAFLDEDTAAIHIKRTVLQKNEVRESYWLITLSFEYSLTPETESNRFLNPLGFTVTSYRKDAEIIHGINH